MPRHDKDPATYDLRLGLLRREKFDADLDAAIVVASGSGEPLSLVMADLDRFKFINDHHGHVVGDEVLVAVATLMTRVVGSKGTCYRFGGEELSMLLPNYVANEAAALAERLRTEVAQARVTSKAVDVTASFGVAEFPAHALSSVDLLKAADSALYQAKNLGRNLVRITDEPIPTPETPKAPSRRQPEPDELRADVAEAIRLFYFTHRYAECPYDGAMLDVEVSATHNRRTADLSIFCPVCGLRTVLRGPS